MGRKKKKGGKKGTGKGKGGKRRDEKGEGEGEGKKRRDEEGKGKEMERRKSELLQVRNKGKIKKEKFRQDKKGEAEGPL